MDKFSELHADHARLKLRMEMRRRGCRGAMDAESKENCTFRPRVFGHGTLRSRRRAPAAAAAGATVHEHLYRLATLPRELHERAPMVASSGYQRAAAVGRNFRRADEVAPSHRAGWLVPRRGPSTGPQYGGKHRPALADASGRMAARYAGPIYGNSPEGRFSARPPNAFERAAAGVHGDGRPSRAPYGTAAYMAAARPASLLPLAEGEGDGAGAGAGASAGAGGGRGAGGGGVATVAQDRQVQQLLGLLNGEGEAAAAAAAAAAQDGEQRPATSHVGVRFGIGGGSSRASTAVGSSRHGGSGGSSIRSSIRSRGSVASSSAASTAAAADAAAARGVRGAGGGGRRTSYFSEEERAARAANFVSAGGSSGSLHRGGSLLHSGHVVRMSAAR